MSYIIIIIIIIIIINEFLTTNKRSTKNWRMKYVLCGSKKQCKWSR